MFYLNVGCSVYSAVVGLWANFRGRMGLLCGLEVGCGNESDSGFVPGNWIDDGAVY